MTPTWQVISWLGSFGFAVCAIPQVVKTYRVGHASDLSWGFLLLWLLGEVCTFAYVLHDIPTSHSLPLIVNYTFNGLCLLILIWYKWRPRKEEKKIDIFRAKKELYDSVFKPRTVKVSPTRKEKEITYKELCDHFFRPRTVKIKVKK